MHSVIIVPSYTKAIFLNQCSQNARMLTFHCIQEAVASGFLQLYHIPGNENPTDLITKILGYQEAMPYLCPFLLGMEIQLISP